MEIFPHVSLHKLPLQILHVRVVGGAEIFFNRHGGGRRHVSSIWHPVPGCDSSKMLDYYQEILWRLSTSKTSPKTCTNRCVPAPAPTGVPFPRRPCLCLSKYCLPRPRCAAGLLSTSESSGSVPERPRSGPDHPLKNCCARTANVDHVLRSGRQRRRKMVSSSSGRAANGRGSSAAATLR